MKSAKGKVECKRQQSKCKMTARSLTQCSSKTCSRSAVHHSAEAAHSRARVQGFSPPLPWFLFILHFDCCLLHSTLPFALFILHFALSSLPVDSRCSLPAIPAMIPILRPSSGRGGTLNPIRRGTRGKEPAGLPDRHPLSDSPPG